MRIIFTLPLLFCLAVVTATVAESADWLRFRGTNGEGVCANVQLPRDFKPENTLWKQDLGGIGHSSPVIVGEQVFISASNPKDGSARLLAFDKKSGKAIWSKPVPAGKYELNKLNSFASCTPASDGSRLFYVGGTPKEIFAVGLQASDGKELWKTSLGAFPSRHGISISPIVVTLGNTASPYAKRIVIVDAQNEQGGFIFGIDATSGKILWKTPRRGKVEKSTPYITPVVFQNAGEPMQVIFACRMHGVFALHPINGKELWSLPCLEARTAFSPIVAGEYVVAGSGSGGGGRELVVIKPGSFDGSRKPELVREITKRTPYVPTPIVVDGLLYWWADSGIVGCQDLKSGKEHYLERVGGTYFGSPVCLGGELHILSRDGKLQTLATGSTFTEPTYVDLGEPSSATLATDGDLIFIRTASKLLAVQGVKKP